MSVSLPIIPASEFFGRCPIPRTTYPLPLCCASGPMPTLERLLVATPLAISALTEKILGRSQVYSNY